MSGAGQIAQVAVGVNSVLAAGRGGQAELHSGCEIVNYAAPGRPVVRAVVVALVHDDAVEEAGRVLAEARFALARHGGLENGEKNAEVGRYPDGLADFSGLTRAGSLSAIEDAL